MSATEFIAPSSLHEAIERCTKFQKLDPKYRAMFQVMLEGHPVHLVDLNNGLLRAMQCASTARGTGPERRKDGELVRAIWDAAWPEAPLVKVYMPKTGPVRNKIVPDLSNREAVEEWLGT